MDWKSFEDVVKYIYEKIGLKSGLMIEGHGASCIVKGKSGIPHQIDVLFSHSDGVHKYLTAVECKYWNSKVGKDTIMKMEGILTDCNIDKGVIVSKFGFTDNTIQYAKHYNIGLVELREPNELDPEFLRNRITFNIKMKFTVQLYEISEILIKPASGDLQKIEYLNKYFSNLLKVSIEEKTKYINSLPELKGKEREVPTDIFNKVLFSMAYLQGKAEQCFIRLPDGNENNLQKFVLAGAEERFYKANPYAIEEYKQEFIPGTIFWNKETLFNCEISEIIIKGQKVEHYEERESQIRDYALMIMKVVFENKKFILNDDGSVIEQDMN